MKPARFSEEQIIELLRAQEAGHARILLIAGWTKALRSNCSHWGLIIQHNSID